MLEIQCNSGDGRSGQRPDQSTVAVPLGALQVDECILGMAQHITVHCHTSNSRAYKRPNALPRVISTHGKLGIVLVHPFHNVSEQLHLEVTGHKDNIEDNKI